MIISSLCEFNNAVNSIVKIEVRAEGRTRLNRLNNESGDGFRLGPSFDRFLHFGECPRFDFGVLSCVIGERIFEERERRCWPVECRYVKLSPYQLSLSINRRVESGRRTL